MSERPPKPRKQDFADMADFMRASAAWAEQWNAWPWGGPKDEDDEYVYEIVAGGESSDSDTIAAGTDYQAGGYPSRPDQGGG